MDTSELPVLLKRRIQAEAIGPIFEEMAEAFGTERAAHVLRQAIAKAAIAEGRRFRARLPDDADVMREFVKLYDLWTLNGALEVEVLRQTETEYDFDVTRCRYAEMYREMGLGEIGSLLSCNRDGTFCRGFDPRLELERAATIMEGAPRCTFRYRLANEP